jgi:hypothetical protein
MAIGRRCEIGCETWPDVGAYRVCPECGEPTTRYRGENIRPISEEEALPRLFEAFYREWDEKMPPTRLLMSPQETIRWEELYPNGRPSQPIAEDA